MLGLDPISLGFVAVIILVGLIGLANLIPRKEAGGLAVNFGILGTFTGILMALWGFDTGDINGSVPQLIGGMKTAFVTSVAGMGVAVLLRAIDLIVPRKQGAGGVRPEDYFQQMVDQSEKLGQIRNGIGEGEGSMVGQIKLLRSDLNDFARKVSESSTKGIIEALQEVVRDFNNTINEQFGENFKELNSAVGKLLVWMEDHEKLVTTSHKALTAALEGQVHTAEQLKAISAEIQKIQQALQSSGASIQRVGRTLELIPPELQKTAASVETLGEASGGLKRVIDTLDASSEALTASSSSLKELAAEAPKASAALRGAASSVQETFDGIKTQQAALTNELSSGLKKAHGQNVAALKAQQDQIEAHQSSLTQQLSSNLTTANQQNAAALKEQQERLSRDLTSANTKNAEAVAAQVKAFDEQMGQQLSQALTALGSQLAQLSGKFVQDYTPLTDSLRQVVRLSEQINKSRGNRG